MDTRSFRQAARAWLDAHADHDTPEPPTALGERDVIAVARDDDDVGEVVEPEHVFDRVDGELRPRMSAELARVIG